MIIFAGILSDVPSRIASYFASFSLSAPIQQNLAALIPFFILLILTLGVIYVIIKFTEGYRRIPLVYTRTGRDERSYFPIRINQAGMIPIIFALSLVTFPYIIGQAIVLKAAGMPEFVKSGANLFISLFNPNTPTWSFVVIFIALVIGFSFFYLSITFDTKEVADSIQKR